MNDRLKKVLGQAKQKRAKPTTSAVLADGSVVEMLYRPDEPLTQFCVAREGEIRYETSILHNGERLVPYSPNNNLLKNDVILFASEPAEYHSEEHLIADIRTFIHSYVDLSPLFQEIAIYDVLLTWVYDSFNELPYLRVRGDAGSGKTRFLLTVGSLCYKPIFASGASTVSPLFRMLDSFRGTLIMDESDFRFSDAKAEIVKILNNGNARGFPVLRSESVQDREFNPRAYTVFGPKLIATRGYFEDRALESRCLTEEMGGERLRRDIPINLTADWKLQARELRNKLLTFRFKNFGKRQIDPALVDRSIEPRLTQIFGPLLSVIDDPAARRAIQKAARTFHQELLAERGTDTEAQVLEVIRDLLAASVDGRISVKEITDMFVDRHDEDYERKITPRWIGSIVRRKLQLKTQKSHGVFVLSVSEKPKLERLYEKYAIATAETPSEPSNAEQGTDDSGDIGDLGDLQNHSGGLNSQAQ